MSQIPPLTLSRPPHPGAAVQRPGPPRPPPAAVEVFYGDVTNSFTILGGSGLGAALDLNLDLDLDNDLDDDDDDDDDDNNHDNDDGDGGGDGGGDGDGGSSTSGHDSSALSESDTAESEIELEQPDPLPPRSAEFEPTGLKTKTTKTADFDQFDSEDDDSAIEEIYEVCKRVFACEGIVFGSIVRRLFFEPCPKHSWAALSSTSKSTYMSRVTIDCTFPSPEVAQLFLRHLQCDFQVIKRQQSPLFYNTGETKFRVSRPSVAGCGNSASPLIKVFPYITVNIHNLTKHNSMELTQEWTYAIPEGAPAAYFDIDMITMTGYNSIEASTHVCGDGRRASPALLHISRRCCEGRFCLVNGLSVKNGSHFLRCYHLACNLVRRGYVFDRVWAQNTSFMRRGGLPFRHAVVRALGTEEEFRCPISLYDHQADRLKVKPRRGGRKSNTKKDGAASRFLVIETPCRHLFGAEALLQYVDKRLTDVDNPMGIDEDDDSVDRALKCPLCKRTLVADLLG